jgi:hypothetical protein
VPVLATVAVLAIAVVAYLLVQEGGSSASSDTTSTSAAPDVPTRAEYAAAITFAHERQVDLPEEAWTCAGELTLDALGGAEALAGRGRLPADFVAGTGLEAADVPPGAIDQVAAGLPACGIDFALVLYDLVVDVSAPAPELVECLRANMDVGLTARSFAAQLIGEPNDSPIRQEYFRHSGTVVDACT